MNFPRTKTFSAGVEKIFLGPGKIFFADFKLVFCTHFRTHGFPVYVADALQLRAFSALQWHTQPIYLRPQGARLEMVQMGQGPSAGGNPA